MIMTANREDIDTGDASRSALLHGWLAGLVAGVVLLVIAPLVIRLDGSYLLPTHWRLTLLASALTSAVGVFLLGERWFQWAVAMATGVMCAFALRLRMDIARDPSSHNLLAIELLLDFGNTFLWSAGGAVLGLALRRLDDCAAMRAQWPARWNRRES